MLRLKHVLEKEGITVETIARLWGVSEKTVKNTTAERREATFKEVQLTKGILPAYDVDYLFSSVPD